MSEFDSGAPLVGVVEDYERACAAVQDAWTGEEASGHDALSPEEEAARESLQRAALSVEISDLITRHSDILSTPKLAQTLETLRTSTADAEESAMSAKWLSAPEAADMLNVSIATIRRWSDAGYVITYRTPGKPGNRVYRVEDVGRVYRREK